jgi:hypothetical protein
VLRAKARLVLQDYLALTELQVPQVFAELQEAQAFKDSKEPQDCKVLLVLVHLELPEPQDSKAQSGHKDQLEWLALAELQDSLVELVHLALELQGLQDSLVLLAHREGRLEPRVLLALDQREQLVLLEVMELQEALARQERLEFKEHKEFKELLELRVFREFKEALAQLAWALKAAQVQLE